MGGTFILETRNVIKNPVYKKNIREKSLPFIKKVKNGVFSGRISCLVINILIREHPSR